MRGGKKMEETALSETVSENTGKRKRGRPPSMDKATEAKIDLLFPRITTRRGKQNIDYQMYAEGVLKDDPRFFWVVGNKEMKWKPTLLTELGRCIFDETIKIVALRICELKPKTKDAVAMIRSWRTGKSPKWNVFDLGNHIINAINEYKRHHPGMPWSEVEDVLWVVRGHIQAEQEETEGNS